MSTYKELKRISCLLCSLFACLFFLGFLFGYFCLVGFWWFFGIGFFLFVCFVLGFSLVLFFFNAFLGNNICHFSRGVCSLEH